MGQTLGVDRLVTFTPQPSCFKKDISISDPRLFFCTKTRVKRNMDTYQQTNTKHGVVFLACGKSLFQLSRANDTNMSSTLFHRLYMDELSTLRQLEFCLDTMYHTWRLKIKWVNPVQFVPKWRTLFNARTHFIQFCL